MSEVINTTTTDGVKEVSGWSRLLNHELGHQDDGLYCYKGRVDSSNSPSWLNQWNDLRTQFVSARGWKPEIPEGQDIYDLDEETVHSVVIKDDKVIVGQRLSPIVSPTRSLTFDMLRQNPVMQREIDKNLSKNSKIFYDLTRLVVAEMPKSDRSAKYEISAGISQMLGASYGRALQQHNQSEIDDVTWIYAVEEHFLKSLSAMGIQYSEVARGKADIDDAFDTVVCETSPHLAFKHLRQAVTRDIEDGNPGFSAMTLENVYKGIDLTGYDPRAI